MYLVVVFLTSVVFGVVEPQGGDSLVQALIEAAEQSNGGGPLSPADRVRVRPGPDRFLQLGWNKQNKSQVSQGDAVSVWTENSGMVREIL